MYAFMLKLCEKSEIDRSQFVQISGLGAMAAPMFAAKGNAIINGNFDVNFPLKHAQKDMKLALSLGDQVGCSMPVAAASNVQFENMLASHGDLDFAAVALVNRK
jgi:glyoxylate/succinic semialdehyde reductase